ncbi:hypothetical protein, partial [Acetobacter pomorum]
MTASLKIVGYINPLVADALRDPTSGINVTQLRAEKNASVSEALVSFSDMQAVLAQRDAETARLREYYEASEAINQVGILGATPEMYDRENI